MKRLAIVLLAAAFVVPLPAAPLAAQQAAPRALQAEIARRAPDDLRGFYAARGNAPLWFDGAGRPAGAASILLYKLRSAGFDGLDPAALGADALLPLLEGARSGRTADLARAEIALSKAFASYVRGMRGGPALPMIYESDFLKPVAPSAAYALEQAAAAPSLEQYVSGMAWMHPMYAPLRTAMEDPAYTAPQRKAIWTNLARLRALPAMEQGRFVLVDTASARLLMYEGGQVVDSMKVVVGKPDLPTPAMAGLLRHAIENPYWNVPEDLVQTSIAPNVLSQGLGYLRARGYEVLADYEPGAAKLDPSTIDWRAVRRGERKVHVRQLPGGDNFMGAVKFEFPNPQGIYLHDTPDLHLMDRAARQLSSGCVRLEDADRLHRWLMGTALPRHGRDAPPEQLVPLAEPVPIYITHLTVQPGDGRSLAFFADPYARDARVQIAAR